VVKDVEEESFNIFNNMLLHLRKSFLLALK
jgi:hypothetical protein